ncbi:Glutaredoxin [Rhodotorula toruloides]
MSAREAVEQKIAQGKRTVVFSKRLGRDDQGGSVGFEEAKIVKRGRRAKQILKDAGEDFDVYELDQMDEGFEWQNALASKTGQRTVPSIWIGGKFIGGCSELEAKQRSGELKTLLSGKAQ